MIDTAPAAQSFRQAFGRDPEAFTWAPGRVNLIGEHIDYTGGWVLPVTLQRGVTVAAAAGEPGRFRVHSDKYLDAGVAEYDPHRQAPVQFVNFAHALALESDCPGADIAVLSDLPLERGWSSSAAFGVAVCSALLALNEGMIRPAAAELCQMCQRAEKRALGVSVGLMDQYASVFGRRGHALWFDPYLLEHEHIRLELGRNTLALIDSGQPRRLAQSGYNERLQELAVAYDELRRSLHSFESWRELNPLDILMELNELSPVSRHRLRHVVGEHLRVRAFILSLQNDDPVELGNLLTSSHQSLSEDYMVSTPELDTLVDLLTTTPGIYGARLVGGGFGGGVLALVDRKTLDRALPEALAEYEKRTGLKTEWDSVETGDGAEIMPAGGQAEFVTEWLP